MACGQYADTCLSVGIPPFQEYRSKQFRFGGQFQEGRPGELGGSRRFN